jgi:hypothetical protein
MMARADICRIMGGEDGCDTCGDYSIWQPCNEMIPDHIPDEQIKKWLLATRRLKNV